MATTILPINANHWQYTVIFGIVQDHGITQNLLRVHCRPIYSHVGLSELSKIEKIPGLTILL